MLVDLLLDIRGKLMLVGGLRCWSTYYPPAKINLLLISNSTLTTIVNLQLRLTYP
jgi:hypothetical protein